MPRDKNEKGRVKFRVIEFELDGSDATLQESLRNIAAAITRGNTISIPARPVSSKTAPAMLTSNGDGAELAEAADDVGAAETDGVEAEAPARPSTPRRYKTPKVIPLDLKSGQPSLESFLEEKKPDSDNDRYLAIAYWLKEQLKIEVVTADHIYTSYRFLKLNTQRDASQPLRALKRQGAFESGPTKGTYKITHVGENFVRQMGKK